MFNAHTLNASVQYATAEEIDYLMWEGQFIKPKNVVMLGAGPGILAMATVDTYRAEKKRPPMLTIVDKVTCDWAYQHLVVGMGMSAEFLRCWVDDSADAAKDWTHGRIGLLIIDADHSTEAVLRDIDAWFHHVARGGLVFFHDYLEREGGFNGKEAWREGSVAKALELRDGLSWRLETRVGISAVYRKK